MITTGGPCALVRKGIDQAGSGVNLNKVLARCESLTNFAARVAVVG